MDYRNLELLAQKEWGHINPKLLKAWTESSLARNSSNAMCLPCHSWAIVLLKSELCPRGKGGCTLLLQVLFSCTVIDSRGEEGQRSRTQTFASLWPSNGRRALGCCFGPGQPEDGWAFCEDPHLRPSCCLLLPQLLCGLSEACGAVTDPVSVCLCAHRRERAGAGWCLQHQCFVRVPGSVLSNLQPPTGPWLSSAAQHWQGALSSGNSESPFQSLASYILFISPRAHLRDYLSCYSPSWIQLLIW